MVFPLCLKLAKVRLLHMVITMSKQLDAVEIARMRASKDLAFKHQAHHSTVTAHLNCQHFEIHKPWKNAL